MGTDPARVAFDSLVALDGELRRLLRLSPHIPQATTLPEALDISEVTLSAALAAQPSDTSAIAATSRAALVTDILEARAAARELVLQTRSRRISTIARSIAQLRGATSVDALVRQTCTELTGALGFCRASYSIVDSDGCTVRHMNPPDERWQAQLPSTRILSRDELGCLATQRPTIVDSTRIHDTQSMATLLGAAHYVVGPVQLGAGVTALFHATRAAPWTVDSADVHIVDIIASTFAVVYERERQATRMRRQQEAIIDAAWKLVADTESSVDAEREFGLGDTLAHRLDSETLDKPALRELLTPREEEVLKLIAAGRSNSGIAEELVITVETVKSHVKRILRKLGAVNRSEAISLYLADTRPLGQ